MLVITRGYIRNASLGKINIYFLLVSGWDIDRFPIHGMRRSPDTKSGRSLSGEQQRFKHQSGILINGNIPNHIRYIAMILEYSHIYIYIISVSDMGIEQKISWNLPNPNALILIILPSEYRHRMPVPRFQHVLGLLGINQPWGG
jgi:hypothetical protein